MAKNAAPRYTINGNPGSTGSTGMAPTLTTAAADYTGVSANNQLVFTANSNGSRIVGLHFEALGTNVASVARIYINNGSTPATATNNSLVGKLTLAATTASNVASEQAADFLFVGGSADLPSGFRIYTGLGTTVAAGWAVSPILGGDF